MSLFHEARFLLLFYFAQIGAQRRCGWGGGALGDRGAYPIGNAAAARPAPRPEGLPACELLISYPTLCGGFGLYNPAAKCEVIFARALRTALRAAYRRLSGLTGRQSQKEADTYSPRSQAQFLAVNGVRKSESGQSFTISELA